MKAGLLIVGSIIVIVGVLYGLAFVGIIPTRKWAEKSPKMARMLAALHLAPKVKPKKAAAAPDPALAALDAQKKQLVADRAQLDKDQAAFEDEKQKAAAPAAASNPNSAAPPPAPGAKLAAIYATMSPDDLARIFIKLPDPAVASTLSHLDEKKAGKILAALPSDRAARLSLTLGR